MDVETLTDDTNHFTYPNLMRQNEKLKIVHQRLTFIQSEMKRKEQQINVCEICLEQKHVEHKSLL